MSTDNKTTDEWAVVAICTDGSVTEPFGTYGSEREAELMCELNNGLPLQPRHVDHYEVRPNE